MSELMDLKKEKNFFETRRQSSIRRWGCKSGLRGELMRRCLLTCLVVTTLALDL